MYGIRFRDENHSEIFLDHNSLKHPPKLVACSMIEFMQRYADNPEDLEAWIVE